VILTPETEGKIADKDKDVV